MLIMKHLLTILFLMLAGTAQSEPFGNHPRVLINAGPLYNKSVQAQREIVNDAKQLELCRERNSYSYCTDAMLKLLRIIDQGKRQNGWARIGFINRDINMSIRGVHETVDVWSSPLETMSSGTGDCEDYALAKFFALHEVGIDYADLRIAIVLNKQNREVHAVVVVRYDNEWRLLDNRNNLMTSDALTFYEPQYVISVGKVEKLL